MSGRGKITVAVFVLAVSWAVPGPSQAQGLFESLFGGFGRAARAPVEAIPRQAVPPRLQPFVFGDRPRQRVSRRTSRGGGGDVAFCVRTCDGRYFPAPAAGGQSRADVCDNFCPATETRVFYGSSIDHARGLDGRSYSELQNAFRYRNELVSNCSCNGKDPVGLARVDINEDRTLRRGDIVASGDGLMVATGRASRSGAVGLAEMPASVRASFARIPVVAAE